MGLLSRALASVLPEQKAGFSHSIPTWQSGSTPPPSSTSFQRYAREGYGSNELVYACIEQLCTSVAEPRLAAYRRGSVDSEPEQIETHPILDLLERPNPFMSRFLFLSSWMMYRAIAGNNYVEIVTARNQKPVELWIWRPDRARVVPDAQAYIKGYEVQVGLDWRPVDSKRMMHDRTRAPLDDYYGMPPIAAAAGRIDTDNAMREFTRSFFNNAGVPAGLLNIEQQTTDAQKELIRAQYRGNYAGPGGWHSLMVMAGGKATYTPMGMPMGEEGLALEAVENINASRICMCWGVPLSIVGAKLGMMTSSDSNRAADMQGFWLNTLVPIYREIAAVLNTGLVPYYPDIDYVEFDLSDVKALQEDRNEFHTRVRADLQAGIIARGQARDILGYAEPEDDDVYLIPMNVVAEPVKLAPESDPTVSGVPRLGAGTLPKDETADDNETPPTATSNGHKPKESVPT